jgi:hypothetical protein
MEAGNKNNKKYIDWPKLSLASLVHKRHEKAKLLQDTKRYALHIKYSVQRYR